MPTRHWNNMRECWLIFVFVIAGSGAVLDAATNYNPLAYGSLYTTAPRDGQSSSTYYFSFCSSKSETPLTNVTVTLEHGGRKEQLHLFWMTPQCLGAKYRFHGGEASKTSEVMRLFVIQDKFAGFQSFTQLQEKIEFFVVNDGPITQSLPISPEVRIQLIKSIVYMRNRDKVDAWTPKLHACINKSVEEMESRDVSNDRLPFLRQTTRKKLLSEETMNSGGDSSNQFATAVSNLRNGKFDEATAEFNFLLVKSYTPAIRWLSAYYLIELACEQAKKTGDLASRKDLTGKALQAAEILQNTWPGIDGIPEVLGNIGILAFEASEIEKALEAFRQAEHHGLVYTEGEHDIYLYRYACTLEKAGRKEEAYSRYKELMFGPYPGCYGPMIRRDHAVFATTNLIASPK